MEKFLIDLFVTATAISSGDVAGGDDETVVVSALLSGRGLMTTEAVNAALGVLAHFVFVDDGVLGAGVTVGAFAGSAYQFGTRLFGFGSWTSAIEQKGSDDHREGDGDCDKDVTKGHGSLAALAEQLHHQMRGISRSRIILKIQKVLHGRRNGWADAVRDGLCGRVP